MRVTRNGVLWSAWLVAALLLLEVLDERLYGLVVPASALVLAALVGSRRRPDGPRDRTDLLVVAGLYAGVVVLFRLAFGYFGTEAVLGLFLCFGAGLVLGVAGPVWYTVWVRHRSLRSLGLRRDNWRETAALGLALAGIQFLLTLHGYPFPQPQDWVPLLVMALTVGVFEAVFFRGFVQGRLEAAFGPVAGIGGAAGLYALYHVGYGMAADEMLFLFGLGMVYAVAFAVVRNVLVLWPLLTPLGGFFANLDSGDIQLPWPAILGFADVLAVMATVVLLAARRERASSGGAAAGGAAARPAHRGDRPGRGRGRRPTR